MASGQRPDPVGWYEPPLYGRTLSIAIAFVSGCLIAFLLASKVLAVKDWRLLPYTMWGIYVIITIMNFVLHIAEFDKGHCVIGLQKPVIIPLISFDALVNVYLTLSFLVPLTNYVTEHAISEDTGQCQTEEAGQEDVYRLLLHAGEQHHVNFRNLTVLMALNGEESWLCLMCCNSDILFSAIVMHWLTSSNEHSASNKKPAYANAYARRSQQSAPVSRSATDDTAAVAQPLMVATTPTKVGPAIGETSWMGDPESNRSQPC
ncbi:hypothetical protein KVR01_000047 [Diaporthe batatas]|uniref:uncharacterized protein n=1 Tax=Diaporthe batatas TaxID=748121 RepID=UPI001D04ACDF|nr:uncharacterized protein KVR01_000047 [Diaporthe batatas]KAG8169302.1 hypothetical protein KVR01_000047 [Diaporthe batatas]